MPNSVSEGVIKMSLGASELNNKGYEKGSRVYDVFEDNYSRAYLMDQAMSVINGFEEINNENLDTYDSALKRSLVFPKVANAMFLTIYSDFEYFLIELCKAYEDVLELRVKFNDLKGDGVIGAFDYLDKVVGIDNVKNNECYQDIPHWNRIRNLLIHNSAIIETKWEDSVNRLGLKRAESLGNELISLTFQDCDRFINLVESVQKYLLK